jgi:hypothetical protein
MSVISLKKVKLSLCLINYVLHHEDVWANRGTAPTFLTSALDGGDSLVSRPSRFTPGTHWTGGWVRPTASLDVVDKITFKYCDKKYLINHMYSYISSDFCA